MVTLVYAAHDEDHNGALALKFGSNAKRADLVRVAAHSQRRGQSNMRTLIQLGWFVLGLKTGWSVTSEPDAVATFPEEASVPK